MGERSKRTASRLVWARPWRGGSKRQVYEVSRLAKPVGRGLCSKAEPVSLAYWATKREEGFDMRRFDGAGAKILRVPAHILAYLLGQAERLLWSQ